MPLPRPRLTLREVHSRLDLMMRVQGLDKKQDQTMVEDLLQDLERALERNAILWADGYLDDQTVVVDQQISTAEFRRSLTAIQDAADTLGRLRPAKGGSR